MGPFAFNAKQAVESLEYAVELAGGAEQVHVIFRAQIPHSLNRLLPCPIHCGKVFAELHVVLSCGQQITGNRRDKEPSQGCVDTRGRWAEIVLAPREVRNPSKQAVGGLLAQGVDGKHCLRITGEVPFPVRVDGHVADAFPLGFHQPLGGL